MKYKWTKFFLPLLLFCGKSEKNVSDRIVIATSIAPLADFARQIGGDQVSVFSLVPPGVNPHTFELSPEQLRRLAGARLLILNGIGLEYWASKVVDNFNSKSLCVVVASDGIPVLQDDDHATGNPHVWLNPLNAIQQVKKIAEALINLDPGHAELYRKNSDRYQQVLHKLDQEIALETAFWKSKAFICFHPSWNYFANHYNLVQAAVIEKRPGFEPSPGEAVEIIKTAKKLRARAIFAEKQFPIKISEMIAKESGAEVLVLDPLGMDAEDYSFTTLLRENVKQMARALR